MEVGSKLVNLSCSMDFQNLISCIECHKEDRNVEVIIKSLKTIVNICANEDLGKDTFRNVGGLDFLLQFLIETDQVIILDYSLNVLAFVIDGNVHSQTYMTNSKVFGILLAIFDKKTYPLTTLRNALMLLSTISFQNRAAQELIFKNGCLSILINLYTFYAPNAYNYVASNDSDYLDLWMNINRALCFAVNNPLNEQNQVLCSELFPVSLRIIESSSSLSIIEATSSFLALAIANNEKAQNAFVEFDGYLILMHLLGKAFVNLQSCMEQSNNFVRKETLQIISCVISIISASVLDHKENSAICGELGIVSHMIKLLFTGVLNPSLSKKIILALSHCTDACEENRLIIINTSNFDLLLKKNIDTDDPELITAAKCLLQICIGHLEHLDDGQDEDDIHFTENSLPFQNLIKNFAPHSKNNRGSTGSHDKLKNIFNTQELMSYKRAETGNPFFNGQPEETKTKRSGYTSFDEIVRGQDIRKKKLTPSQNNIFSRGRNLESISESDSSLESAGHLFRKQQRKFLERNKKCKESEIKGDYFADKSNSYGPSDLESSLNIHSSNSFMKAKQKTRNKSELKNSEIEDSSFKSYEGNNAIHSSNKSNDQTAKGKHSSTLQSNAFSVTSKEFDTRFDSKFPKSPDSRNLELTSCYFHNIVKENKGICSAGDSNCCSKANSGNDFNLQISSSPETEMALKRSDLENFARKNESDTNSYKQKQIKSGLPEGFSCNSCELENTAAQIIPHFTSAKKAEDCSAVSENQVQSDLPEDFSGNSGELEKTTAQIIPHFTLAKKAEAYSAVSEKQVQSDLPEDFSCNSGELEKTTVKIIPHFTLAKKAEDYSAVSEKQVQSVLPEANCNSCELGDITSEFTPHFGSTKDHSAVAQKQVENVLAADFYCNPSNLESTTSELTPHLLSAENDTVQSALTEKLVDEPRNFKLPSFRKPYSLTEIKDRKKKRSKGVASRNTTNCMEVIVLPGINCCEHNLASQFELLEVCRISEASSSK